MTIRELQKKYASVPWLDYVNGILKTKQTVSNNEVILVGVPKFIGSLEELLKDAPRR